MDPTIYQRINQAFLTCKLARLLNLYAFHIQLINMLYPMLIKRQLANMRQMKDLLATMEYLEIPIFKSDYLTRIYKPFLSSGFLF